ncbi:hypothetical protein ABET52_12595 [Saccharococcus caldoxylosilyticus]|uniref:hypothetical protein n=1 Tax=Saccharococcus caldoxylosilyticus TaxID=81408 RepID=UPI003D32741A
MNEKIVLPKEQLDKTILDTKNGGDGNQISLDIKEHNELLQYERELTDKEKVIEAKQQELWQREVSLSLKENGLEKFADIVKVSNEDELKDVIKKLIKIVNEIKIETGYVPSDHKQMTAYEQAKKQGNTKNMIKAIFGMKD